MSAVLCRKRSNFFEESPSSPPSSKRIRCSSFSPPPTSPSSLLIDYLGALFPDMDKQFLEKALEESGDDLDSAIKRLTKLRLSAAESSTSDFIRGIGDHLFAKGPAANNEYTDSREESESVRNPANGADWVELIVGEVANASNVDEAKMRVARALEALQKSIFESAASEAAQTFQENAILKQQLGSILQENAILKRAVAIQHDRQKEHEEKGRELSQLKQLVSQYQEQLRTLEVNNYALAMHLKQAQQSNSLPSGRYNPDVF